EDREPMVAKTMLQYRLARGAGKPARFLLILQLVLQSDEKRVAQLSQIRVGALHRAALEDEVAGQSNDEQKDCKQRGVPKREPNSHGAIHGSSDHGDWRRRGFFPYLNRCLKPIRSLVRRDIRHPSGYESIVYESRSQSSDASGSHTLRSSSRRGRRSRPTRVRRSPRGRRRYPPFARGTRVARTPLSSKRCCARRALPSVLRCR